MTTPQRKQNRDEEIAEALEESAEAQHEWANILRQVAQRMDSLSDDMRKHGAFPIVGTVERERRRAEERSNAKRP